MGPSDDKHGCPSERKKRKFHLPPGYYRCECVTPRKRQQLRILGISYYPTGTCSSVIDIIRVIQVDVIWVIRVDEIWTIREDVIWVIRVDVIWVIVVDVIQVIRVEVIWVIWADGIWNASKKSTWFVRRTCAISATAQLGLEGACFSTLCGKCAARVHAFQNILIGAQFQSSILCILWIDSLNLFQARLYI
jgi:hypothetical protein